MWLFVIAGLKCPPSLCSLKRRGLLSSLGRVQLQMTYAQPATIVPNYTSVCFIDEYC